MSARYQDFVKVEITGPTSRFYTADPTAEHVGRTGKVKLVHVSAEQLSSGTGDKAHLCHLDGGGTAWIWPKRFRVLN